MMPSAQARVIDETPAESTGLPPLSSPYPVSPVQLASFEKTGHVKLSGVLTADEIEAYRPRLNEVVTTRNSQSHGMEQKVAGAGKNWMFVNNLWTHDAAARAFVTCRRFGRIAAELLGVEAVRLFRDQSYFKGAGGANTAWHQDAHFMPLDTKKIITMWIPLTRITRDLAPMDYVSGSHHAGYLGTSNGDDASMDRFSHEMVEKGFEIHNYETLEAGDVVAHSAWTLHSSRSNTSMMTREVIVIVFFADGARMIQDPPVPQNAPSQEHFARLIRKQNRETSLPGVQYGELAQGPMVPLAYSRSWEAQS